jgi:hypothetical protein
MNPIEKIEYLIHINHDIISKIIKDKIVIIEIIFSCYTHNNNISCEIYNYFNSELVNNKVINFINQYKAKHDCKNINYLLDILINNKNIFQSLNYYKLNKPNLIDLFTYINKTFSNSFDFLNYFESYAIKILHWFDHNIKILFEENKVLYNNINVQTNSCSEDNKIKILEYKIQLLLNNQKIHESRIKDYKHRIEILETNQHMSIDFLNKF